MQTADYIKTFALVTIVLFFALQKGSGPLLSILALFFMVPLFYNAIRMFRRPEERKRRGTRLAIWSIALALAFSVQIYWSKASHNAAELALTKVLTYKERTGAYPTGLREVGLDDKYLKDEWQLRYSADKGKAWLTYPMPFMPLATYEYDFDARKWRKNVY